MNAALSRSLLLASWILVFGFGVIVEVGIIFRIVSTHAEKVGSYPVVKPLHKF